MLTISKEHLRAPGLQEETSFFGLDPYLGRYVGKVGRQDCPFSRVAKPSGLGLECAVRAFVARNPFMV